MGSSGDFYDAIGGRLYLVKAPQGATFPFAVYDLITATDELDFSEENETFQIQFDIWTQKAASNSMDEAGDILGYLKTVYDDCDLTVDGWRALSMVRDFVVPNNDFSQDPPVLGYSVQYTIELEKSK